MKNFKFLALFITALCITHFSVAQTVTITGGQFLAAESGPGGFDVCGAAPATAFDEDFDRVYISGAGGSSPATVVLNFSSPVTQISLPFIDFGATTNGTLSVYETYTFTPNVGNVELAETCFGYNYPGGNTVSSTSARGAGTFNDKGDFIITGTEPFTSLTLTAVNSQSDLAIPTADFLNNYAGFIIGGSATCNAGTAFPAVSGN